jgi:hypothetical protein
LHFGISGIPGNPEKTCFHRNRAAGTPDSGKLGFLGFREISGTFYTIEKNSGNFGKTGNSEFDTLHFFFRVLRVSVYSVAKKENPKTPK